MALGLRLYPGSRAPAGQVCQCAQDNGLGAQRAAHHGSRFPPAHRLSLRPTKRMLELVIAVRNHIEHPPNSWPPHSLVRRVSRHSLFSPSSTSILLTLKSVQSSIFGSRGGSSLIGRMLKVEREDTQVFSCLVVSATPILDGDTYSAPHCPGSLAFMQEPVSRFLIPCWFYLIFKSPTFTRDRPGRMSPPIIPQPHSKRVYQLH